MSARPWYAWYSADYKRKTAHLNFVEDSAYRRLLDAYYDRGGPIESDRGGLFRITGAMTQEEQDAVDKCAKDFFYLNDNMLHHKRADEELSKQAGIRERLSEAGKRGGALAGRGRPIVSDRGGSGIVTTTITSTGTVTPTITKFNNKAPARTLRAFALPPDLDPALWADYEEMRKKIRKPMTDRARWLIVGKLANLAQEGHDKRQVLQQSIRNGWQDVFQIRPEKTK